MLILTWPCSYFNYQCNAGADWNIFKRDSESKHCSLLQHAPQPTASFCHADEWPPRIANAQLWSICHFTHWHWCFDLHLCKSSQYQQSQKICFIYDYAWPFLVQFFSLFELKCLLPGFSELVIMCLKQKEKNFGILMFETK